MDYSQNHKMSITLFQYVYNQGKAIQFDSSYMVCILRFFSYGLLLFRHLMMKCAAIESYFFCHQKPLAIGWCSTITRMSFRHDSDNVHQTGMTQSMNETNDYELFQHKRQWRITETVRRKDGSSHPHALAPILKGKAGKAKWKWTPLGREVTDCPDDTGMRRVY